MWHPLTDKAITLICTPKVALQEDGNKAARKVVVEIAVIHGGPPGVETLENIFQCVYNKDLRS